MIHSSMYFQTKEQAEEYAANFRERWYGYTAIASVTFDGSKNKYRVDTYRGESCD